MFAKRWVEKIFLILRIISILNSISQDYFRPSDHDEDSDFQPEDSVFQFTEHFTFQPEDSAFQPADQVASIRAVIKE